MVHPRMLARLNSMPIGDLHAARGRGVGASQCVWRLRSPGSRQFNTYELFTIRIVYRGGSGRPVRGAICVAKDAKRALTSR